MSVPAVPFDHCRQVQLPAHTDVIRFNGSGKTISKHYLIFWHLRLLKLGQLGFIRTLHYLFFERVMKLLTTINQNHVSASWNFHCVILTSSNGAFGIWYNFRYNSGVQNLTSLQQEHYGMGIDFHSETRRWQNHRWKWRRFHR